MSNDVENNGRPVPEVHEKPVRRRFTAEYKMRIIEEASACSDKSQVGELLRREVLYSSHLFGLVFVFVGKLLKLYAKLDRKLDAAL